jgi:hypothetical protein
MSLNRQVYRVGGSGCGETSTVGVPGMGVRNRRQYQGDGEMAGQKVAGWHIASVVISMLVVAACGASTDTTDAGSSTEANGDPTEFPTPTPEFTGTEKPRPPRPQPSVPIAGPAIGEGDDWIFNVDSPANCLRVILIDEFAEDARVESIFVGPAGVFERDDTPCHEEGNAPLCDGFVFRGEDEDPACYVGVRWLPESGAFDGEIAMSFSATCHTLDGPCHELDTTPPADGTPVTFTSARALTAPKPDGDQNGDDQDGDQDGDDQDGDQDGDDQDGDQDGDDQDGDDQDGDDQDGDQDGDEQNGEG